MLDLRKVGDAGTRVNINTRTLYLTPSRKLLRAIDDYAGKEMSREEALDIRTLLGGGRGVLLPRPWCACLRAGDGYHVWLCDVIALRWCNNCWSGKEKTITWWLAMDLQAICFMSEEDLKGRDENEKNV